MNTYELVLNDENVVLATVRAYSMPIAIDYFKERNWPIDKMRFTVREKIVVRHVAA